jgi:hypothetical protein
VRRCQREAVRQPIGLHDGSQSTSVNWLDRGDRTRRVGQTCGLDVA